MPAFTEYLGINEISALQKVIYDARDRAIITLLLSTGIFLNELTELTIDNIDLEKKSVRISGKRAREIILNDQAVDALNHWLKERPDSNIQELFITTKGKAKGLSARSVDNLIRNYALDAGIKHKVNAQMLRSTFAVRLFQQSISTSEATAILGITDPESIRRYILAAKQPATDQQTAHTLNELDTRSVPNKFLANLFQDKIQTKKRASNLQIPVMANPEEIIFGRDKEINEIRKLLDNRHLTLVTGQIGVGHTHLLKYLARHYGNDKQIIYIASPVPIKQMLTEIYQALDPDGAAKLSQRTSVKELLELILLKRNNQELILIIDQLDKLRLSDLDTMLMLANNFTILGAAHEQQPRLKELWWKFKIVELLPLDQETAKTLIRYLTQNLTIGDYQLLETRILTLSNGLPLAMVEMVKSLNKENVVTTRAIRDLYHEAGVKYRDWSYIIVILLACVIIFRFISLGTHSFEGYILAGMAAAVLMVVRFFMFRMR